MKLTRNLAGKFVSIIVFLLLSACGNEKDTEAGENGNSKNSYGVINKYYSELITGFSIKEERDLNENNDVNVQVNDG